jgi:hypothetical protein
MMKKVKAFLFTVLIIAAFASCKAQQNLLIQKIDEAGSNQVLEDSIINNLRNNNDIVIAYAVENFAWVRKINYTILAQKNGEWKGYQYNVSLMKQNPSQSITSINIKKNACDSLMNFIAQTKAWTIKGDNDSSFCANGSKNCNINDASSARLWIITKKTVFNSSYYAPEFYETCCPDKERALFLSIKNKIENSVSISSEQGSNM